MVDRYRQRLELRRLIEETSGIRNLRTVEEQIRKIIEPLRTPYVTVMERFIEDATRQRAMSENFLRATAPFSIRQTLEQALATTFPESVRAFFDRAADQRTRFEDYLRDATRAQRDPLKIAAGLFGRFDPRIFSGSERLASEIERIKALTSGLRQAPQSRPLWVDSTTSLLE